MYARDEADHIASGTFTDVTGISVACPPAAVVKSEIVAGLLSLGLADDTVLVHTSMRAIGYVVGGTRTVVEALLSVCGTVMMPAYSGDLSDPSEWRRPPVDRVETIRSEIPPFDPYRTPTRGMGAVAEYFRTYPGTVRSKHPQSSFCANGPDAVRLLAKHGDDFRFGPDSPLGTLRAMGGKILMLGAPWNTCSALYLDQIGPVITKRSPVSTGNATKWIEYRDIEYSDRDFHAIIKSKIECGAKTGKIGNADCVTFSA